jgi:hypothetical protein
LKNKNIKKKESNSNKLENKDNNKIKSEKIMKSSNKDMIKNLKNKEIKKDKIKITILL